MHAAASSAVMRPPAERSSKEAAGTIGPSTSASRLAGARAVCPRVGVVRVRSQPKPSRTIRHDADEGDHATAASRANMRQRILPSRQHVHRDHREDAEVGRGLDAPGSDGQHDRQHPVAAVGGDERAEQQRAHQAFEVGGRDDLHQHQRVEGGESQRLDPARAGELGGEDADARWR